MRKVRWPVLGAAVAGAAAIATTALAAGPWPGLARSVRDDGSGVSYAAKAARGATTVRALENGRVVRSATFDGVYGVPAVTLGGQAGGLSPDGRLLVLAEPPNFEELRLRTRSRFLVVSTRALTPVATIALPGEFGFDAISPNRRFLYLIQHTTNRDLVRYVVRAYDLHSKRLLPGAIVDKREAGEVMRGYPASRAESAHGTWVYTLYQRPQEGIPPFVHALNAAARTAFCIDLPSWPSGVEAWDARLELTVDGRQLLVRVAGRTVATIDTATLEVQ